jgi:aromatic-L-amino-acid decarboxylase
MANDTTAGDALLDIPTEQMRASGYRVIDMLVERLASLEGGPVWQGATRAEMESRLREPPPQDPESLERILEQLATDVLPYAGRIDHPRFMAFVAGSGTWPGILGDLIASGFNIFQGTWLASAGPSQVELIVLDWFKEWLSYPPEASGILVSGGSVANLTALACAREIRLGAHSPDAVIYTSAEAHSSVERAARVLGFAKDRVRSLPTDAGHRLDARQLAQAIEGDLAQDLKPFCVIANAGATSNGAMDPLDTIASIAHENGLWYHVDAAYGGFAVLTERGREWLKGIERADSITLDPHKWLYQPFEVGCLLVRNGVHLRDAFHIMPDYLQDTVVGGGGVNFADRGIQLTRMSRALKIWMSLKHFGVPAFAATIDHCLDLTVRAAELIQESDRFELLAGPALSIVCFRRRVNGSPEHADRANVQLLEQLRENGVGMISSTRVNGVYALRMCILNHRTSWRDVEPVLRWLEQQPVPVPVPVG